MLLDSYNEKDIIDWYMQEIKACMDLLVTQEKRIKQAIAFAQKAHAWQIREWSKRPYLHHPLKVSYNLAKDFQDIDLILAGILHDTVDHNENITIKSIYDMFGDTVWYMVDALTWKNLYFFKNKSKKKVFTDKFEKLLAGWMQDIRCLILQLYNNAHNFLSISWLTIKQQTKMCFETQAIYKPLEDILQLKNKKLSYEERANLLKKYMRKHKIQTCSDLKSALISETFTNFDDETFFLAYNNTDKIIWEINDEVVFAHILEIDNVDEKIEILRLESDKFGHFKVMFTYKTWHVFDIPPKGKININAFIK